MMLVPTLVVMATGAQQPLGYVLAAGVTGALIAAAASVLTTVLNRKAEADRWDERIKEDRERWRLEGERAVEQRLFDERKVIYAEVYGGMETLRSLFTEVVSALRGERRIDNPSSYLTKLDEIQPGLIKAMSRAALLGSAAFRQGVTDLRGAWEQTLINVTVEGQMQGSAAAQQATDEAIAALGAATLAFRVSARADLGVENLEVIPGEES